MHQQITWHNASPVDWELARQREAVIRPLAAQTIPDAYLWSSAKPPVRSSSGAAWSITSLLHTGSSHRPQRGCLVGADARGDRGSSIPVALVLAALGSQRRIH
jgi:hypothetical protein